MQHFFYSLITFIIAIFFVLIGIGCMLIPWVTPVRSLFVQFIVENTIAIFLFGFAFFVIGTALFMQVILASQKKYYHVRSGKKAISIDENLIQECLGTYWKAKFPGEEIPYHLILKDNTIHITVDLPYLVQEQQEMMVDRIKNDISHIFASTLGYHKEFFLNVSFNKSES